MGGNCFAKDDKAERKSLKCECFFFLSGLEFLCFHYCGDNFRNRDTRGVRAVDSEEENVSMKCLFTKQDLGEAVAHM